MVLVLVAEVIVVVVAVAAVIAMVGEGALNCSRRLRTFLFDLGTGSGNPANPPLPGGRQSFTS